MHDKTRVCPPTINTLQIWLQIYLTITLLLFAGWKSNSLIPLTSGDIEKYMHNLDNESILPSSATASAPPPGLQPTSADPGSSSIPRNPPSRSGSMDILQRLTSVSEALRAYDASRSNEPFKQPGAPTAFGTAAAGGQGMPGAFNSAAAHASREHSNHAALGAAPAQGDASNWNGSSAAPFSGAAACRPQLSGRFSSMDIAALLSNSSAMDNSRNVSLDIAKLDLPLQCQRTPPGGLDATPAADQRDQAAAAASSGPSTGKKRTASFASLRQM